MLKRLPLFLLLLIAVPLAAQELSPAARQMDRWFHEAAGEFDVPVEVLQSIAFVETRWSHRIVARRDADRGWRHADRETEHEHQPAAYGVMGLRDDDHFGHSLLDAAALIARTPDELRLDPQLNIRGAAALLKQYAPGLTRESAVELWEGAVARLSGIPQPGIAQMHTYDVFNTIVSGRAATGSASRRRSSRWRRSTGRNSSRSSPRRA
jgi:hypothetical protein